jgi:hypothetical protein
MIIEEKNFKIGLNVDNYKIGKVQKVGSTSKKQEGIFYHYPPQHKSHTKCKNLAWKIQIPSSTNLAAKMF